MMCPKVWSSTTNPITVLFRYCAWCGKFLGTKDGQGISGITYGLCPECAKKIME